LRPRKAISSGNVRAWAVWVRSFATVEELRRALLAFREVYNATWLIERHGFRPPAAIRAEQLQPAALAA
jgi:putative transposase